MRTIHSGNTGVLGNRVGAGGRPGEPERALADSAPRVEISFWCVSLHKTTPVFSATAKIPETWPCRCGQPAGPDKGSPPPPERFRMMRSGEDTTHLDRVKQRRPSAAEREEILSWALERRRRAQAAARKVSHHVEVVCREVDIEESAPLVGEIQLAGVITVRRCQPRRLSRAARQRQGRCQALLS